MGARRDIVKSVAHPVAREPGSGSGLMSRLTIDACRPYGSAGAFPRINKVSDEARARVMAKWGKVVNQYGQGRATGTGA